MVIEKLNILQTQLAEISPSFQSTPVGMEREAINRPMGRRGPRTTKPRQYADEWVKKIDTPQNAGYYVAYSKDKFKLMYSEQHNATLIQKFECDNSHRVIKSYFVLLGLHNYDCEAFCEAASLGVTLCEGELSPEGSALSYYVS
jgi:hypothetical protein